MNFRNLFYTYSSTLRNTVRDCSYKLFYYVDKVRNLYDNGEVPSIVVCNMNGHWK